MADANDSQGGTSGDAGAGGTGAGAGGAGAGGTSGTSDGSTGGAGAPWHGLTDAADVAYVNNKGWKSTPEMYKGYRGAEGLLGRDPSTLLVMPRSDDPAGFRAVMSKLGMPETHDKYEVDIPKGTDPKYGDWAKQTFHKVGLTAAQAKELTKANNEFFAAQQAEQGKAYDLQIQTEKRSLLTEWGGGFERKMSAAQTAAKSLGMSPEMIDGMEQAIGYSATMKYLADLGTRLGEDSFVSSEKKPGFGGSLTPEEAKVQWEETKLDAAYVKALNDNTHPGHRAAIAKKQQLFSIMFPS